MTFDPSEDGCRKLLRKSGNELPNNTASYCKDNASYFGHVVAQLVEALRYKPEGRGFDSR